MNCLTVLNDNPLFDTVPDDQLTWLVDRGECRDFPADTILYQPGDPVDHLFILLEGRFQMYTLQAGQQHELGIWEAGSLSGVLPFSRMKESATFWKTLEPAAALLLHRDHFREMIQTQYELTEVLVHQMTTRVREYTRQMQQNEKMISLGRLSAGLAHELNNPVAAIVRSVGTLKEHLHATPEQFKKVLTLQLEPEKVDEIQTLLFEKIRQRGQSARLSLLEKSSREDDLTDWLDDHDVPGATSLAENLTEAGFSPDDLDTIARITSPDSLPTVLNWLCNNLMTEALVNEITDASGRIATLIGAIKSYTHMDRGIGKDCIQIREGLESTLTLLKHKLKTKNIRVALDMHPDLPAVEAFPSELNQVWTNLADNAIDAMPEGGQLTISAQPDREFVDVRFVDNGSGIPADIKDRIFDPFFTTKEIGKGTGLGLDIVQSIIDHHHGKIYVDSRPGRTEFKVCLPVKMND
ncbi:ATP-binding protein [Tellurirhabdus rosea]|uniref:ATP-binding protein n=1 Tax=Tellurirhabdus rosea TaxID=2674997 RepID=UPI00224D526F|nr:ATP-binding protein [Tellurirhabdus rosea]